MFNFKNLKIVKKIKSISPKLKWVMFSQMQDFKINSNYIDAICNDEKSDAVQNAQRLEDMVRDTLVKEFSPDIQNLKSYDLLVDAVVHNIKRKQIQEQDEQEKA